MSGRYLFLLDRDVCKAASLFPRKRTLTLAQVGLSEDASDADIVKVACEKEVIIVTGNGEDFRREILRFQGQTKTNECHELRGLLVLPSGFERQKRLLKTARATMRFGGKQLTWPDIRDGNYYVKLNKTRQPHVFRFPRCHYCAKAELR